ncbi:hypothetical protein NpNSSI1_00002961 [Neofusicoccum parvum]|nr:hypothetical protein NpNSSI1_00002961 [Neofusicoccum parvum]
MQEKRLQPQSQTTVQLPRRSTYLGIDEVYCGKVIHIKRCELHVGNHPAIVLAVNRPTKRVRVWQASSFLEAGGIDGKYNGKYRNKEVMKRNKSGWILVDDGGDTRPHYDTPKVHLVGGRFERTTFIDTGRIHELHISSFAKESFGGALWDVYLPHDQMEVLWNHATSRGSRLVPSNTYRGFGKIDGEREYNLSHDDDLEGLGGDREAEENEKSE